MATTAEEGRVDLVLTAEQFLHSIKNVGLADGEEPFGDVWERGGWPVKGYRTCEPGG